MTCFFSKPNYRAMQLYLQQYSTINCQDRDLGFQQIVMHFAIAFLPVAVATHEEHCIVQQWKNCSQLQGQLCSFRKKEGQRLQAERERTKKKSSLYSQSLSLHQSYCFHFPCCSETKGSNATVQLPRNGIAATPQNYKILGLYHAEKQFRNNVLRTSMTFHLNEYGRRVERSQKVSLINAVFDVAERNKWLGMT